MAKPRPSEDLEAILIRMPESAVKRLRELAADSRNGRGQPMSANQYCVAVLTEAVEAGVTVRERTRYDMIPSSTRLARVAEPSNEEAKPDSVSAKPASDSLSSSDASRSKRR